MDQRLVHLRFQQALQDRVCSEGIDFRLLSSDRPLFIALLSLVPGFEMKTANELVSYLVALPNLKEVSSRQKLCDLKVLSPNLMRNALAFIHFHSSNNRLDATNLPFSKYFIVKEIASKVEKIHHGESNFKKLDESVKQLIENPSLLCSLNVLQYSKELSNRYSRPNMIHVLDGVIDCIRQASQPHKSCNLPVSPIMNFGSVFESIYKIKRLKVSSGAVFMFSFKEETEKYYEFVSKEFKFRARLNKNSLQPGLKLDKWIEKKQNSPVELVIQSMKCFENNDLQGQNPIEVLFENTLTIEQPNLVAIAQTLYSDLLSSKHFLPLDYAQDFPGIPKDISSQFDVFQREMNLNPSNVIDLTHDLPLRNRDQWANSSSSSSSSFSRNTSSNSNWGHSESSEKEVYKKPQDKQQWNQNDRHSWDNKGKSEQDQQPHYRQKQMQSSDQSSLPLREFPASESSSSSWGVQSASFSGENQPSSSSSSWGASTSTNQQSSWGQTSSAEQQKPASSSSWNSSDQQQQSSWGNQSSDDKQQSNSWGNQSSTSNNNNNTMQSSASWGGESTGWGGNSSSSSYPKKDNEPRRNAGGNNNNNNKTCFKCKKEGHFSRECTEVSDNPRQQGQQGGSNQCFKCNQEGHISRNCPNAQKSNLCFKCGQEGHISRECPNPQQSNRSSNNSRECFKCKQEGHLSRDCPNKPVGGGAGGGAGGTKKCFNCNEEGHMSRECPNPSNNRRRGGDNYRKPENASGGNWNSNSSSSWEQGGNSSNNNDNNQNNAWGSSNASSAGWGNEQASSSVQNSSQSSSWGGSSSEQGNSNDNKSSDYKSSW